MAAVAGEKARAREAGLEKEHLPEFDERGVLHLNRFDRVDGFGGKRAEGGEADHGADGGRKKGLLGHGGRSFWWSVSGLYDERMKLADVEMIIWSYYF